MTINVGVIGCGKRFNEFYLDPLLKLQNKNKINIVSLYNRNIVNKSELATLFKCRLTSNIDDIIIDKNIDLIILTVPLELRTKIFSNVNFNPKFLFSEPPFSKNLSQFYKFKKVLKKKLINFEIFEDKYFYDYPFSYDSNLSKIIMINKFWEHHALSFLFKIMDKDIGKLESISFKEYKELEVFKINFNNFLFIYIFSKNKKDAVRKNGRIKIYDSNKKVVELKEVEINSEDTKKAIFKSISNLINFEENKLYSNNYLELENTIISLMKIVRKFKIKKINNIQIFFLKFLFKIYSFF